MDVLVSGATGLIGSALSDELEGGGHRVSRLTRSPKGPDDICWDPSSGTIDGTLDGYDAVVHLAGESIFSGPADRWTSSKKERIMESRRKGTRLLAETIAGLSSPPGVLVSASGINYYGDDHGSELLPEDSAPGSDFLAEVCKDWEASTDPAREAGIRVVNTRFALVLSPRGGALGTTLPIFKLGGGGKVGSGRQWWSWVTLDDVVGVILHAIRDESVEGPVNVGSPNPVINADYTKVLGKVLNRPTFFAVPAPALRIAFGEVADALLLASLRVEPAKLKETGYEYRYPDLYGALRHLLGK